MFVVLLLMFYIFLYMTILYKYISFAEKSEMKSDVTPTESEVASSTTQRSK